MIAEYLAILCFQALATAAALATFWLVSLYVEPETFGRYSLYLALLGAAAMPLVNWPNAALLRFGREEWVQRGRMGETLGARALLYVIAVGLAVGLAWWLDPLAVRFLNLDQSPFVWIALGLALMPLAEIAIYANQALRRSLPYGFAPLLNRTTFLLGVGLLPFLTLRPGWDYLASWAIAGWCLSAAVAWLALPRVAWGGFRPGRVALGRIVSYSWAIPLGAVAAYTVNWVDAWVIRLYLGPAAVGIYQWAYQITALGGLAFAPLNTILIPPTLDAHLAGDRERPGRHGCWSLGLVLLAGVCGALFLPAVFPVLSLAVGPRYQGGYVVLLILLSAVPFQLLGYMMNPLVAPFESLVPKVMALNAGLALVNVIGDLLLVPRIGIVGAAIATWSVFGLGAWSQLYLVRRYVGGPRFPKMFAFVVCSLPMSLAALSLWSAGPVLGAAICLAIGPAALFGARRAGLFAVEDMAWLDRQRLPVPVKRLLEPAARWLAAGRGRVESSD